MSDSLNPGRLPATTVRDGFGSPSSSNSKSRSVTSGKIAERAIFGRVGSARAFRGTHRRTYKSTNTRVSLSVSRAERHTSLIAHSREQRNAKMLSPRKNRSSLSAECAHHTACSVPISAARPRGCSPPSPSASPASCSPPHPSASGPSTYRLSCSNGSSCPSSGW